MSHKIGIIGLGYVGLPLAVEFGKYYPTYGFDINEKRIKELNTGYDSTLETDRDELVNSKKLVLTNSIKDLQECNVFIITVPTPIDNYNTPDLSYLESATTQVSSLLKKGDIIIFESTVFPGCTEEVCVPILEAISGLVFNSDFFCGYSPERIVPGDKNNTLTKIKKVVSASNGDTLETIFSLYSKIIIAGVYKAPSIKVAEAAKAIENAQRDLNISFMNELSLMFDRMKIDTNEVIEAASTKWNFLPYKPGLVGGHCISVDPYYLTYKSKSLGYEPEVILSGRKVNESIPKFIADKCIRLLVEKNHKLEKSKILVLGITFKENCPDIRNSKVFNLIKQFDKFKLSLDVYDPVADSEEVHQAYGIQLLSKIKTKYDCIVLAVPHKEILELDINQFKRTEKSIIFDVKASLPKESSDARL